ncbi:4'-phosphopantetheinyl transferase family protein [Novosphingobium sp. BL-52-GroH]|uniref:4'-phosphopantetheinyl transferase family protein n=1 Tax=Novosphingobium sp. BL-52-GroH TaxID=3349877 RepID=UPI00384E2877
MATKIDVLSMARPLVGDMPLELWLLDLSGMPPAEAIPWLSEEERARAARFAFPRYRERYFNAHIGLRLVLAEYCGFAARRQRFVLGADGKPSLADLPDCHFSLSYAGDVALVGVDCENPVGVDIESDRPIPDADELSALHFHPREQRALASLAGPVRHGTGFLQGWTRKEACLKALGHGLTMPAALLHSGLSGRKPVRMDGQVLLEVGGCPPLPGFTAAWARMTAPASDPRQPAAALWPAPCP